MLERNQRLALALEIRNPDLSNKLGNPNYSQFLKEYAKQNLNFVSGVEKALADLVTATLQPKVCKKSHSFKSMPNMQRRVIHELAESYGCQTESYDEEPNKNVVATAIKDKCWVPNVTLTAMVQRERFPKAPMPIPINCKEADIKSAAQAAKQSTQVYSSDGKSAAAAAASGTTTSKRNNQPYIDYFDMTD
jgi:transcriptional repressor NF-X1